MPRSLARYPPAERSPRASKVTRLQEALSRLAADLNKLDLDWAVVGGLAVSTRAEL